MNNTEYLKKILDLQQGTVSVHEENNSDKFSRVSIQKLVQGIDVDEVYFSNKYPVIYFKYVNQFNDKVSDLIRNVQRKVWNQGKVIFLYVSSDTEIRVYNCYHKPINPKNPKENIDDALLFCASTHDEQALEELKNIFGRVSIETGDFWKQEKYAQKINNRSRVNRVLIQNLKYTRHKLYNNYDLPLDIIHDLLLRSLFLLYLEDRGATDEEFYHKFDKQADSYFQILDFSVEATYNLFERLENSFNGNLCPITYRERNLVNHEHLQIIKECFWDKIETDGQEKLFNWKAFDFKYIPIELISEIYEDFILNEEGEEKKSNDGAYYTPHSLVEFILNKVLPWGDPKTQSNEVNYKVLDPTCGSGIFLVEAFKRLVDRWECNHPGEKKSFKVLKNIVLDNIFGIELNPEAIKVAAFSIYLAMLDQLEPRTLWKDKKFPYLIFDPKNNKGDKTGRNLFLMSSLEDGEFAEIDFDLIVGNPPFKEGDLNREVSNYLEERDYPQEKVIAFLDRSIELCPNGKIALVAGAKPILFNSGSKYKNFRSFLFNECYVEEVYNFAGLRKSNKKHKGNLFESAVGPACVLFFRPTSKGEISEKILYSSPTSTRKNNIIDGIYIDQLDIKYLPREECKDPDSKVWKIAMWGSQKDFHLYKRLSNGLNLEDDLNKMNWRWGNGYQTSKPADKVDNEISKLSTIKTSSIDRYSSCSTGLIETPKKFRRFGQKQSYFAPHVLLKKGLRKKRICASFLNFDCAFRDGVYGISGKKDDIDKLKALTLYINSKLASYLLFLSISSLGVEREQVMLEEYLSLPSFINLLNDQNLKNLTSLYDSLVSEKDELLKKDTDLTIIESQIDDFIYDLFEITDQERYLIEDMIDYKFDLFLEGENSIALNPISTNELERYANVLCESLNHLLLTNDTVASAKVHELPRSIPLRMVVLDFNKKDSSKDTLFREKYKKSIKILLSEIDEFVYNHFSESLYFRKVIKYLKNNQIYLIKPNESKFWTRSEALNDSNDIIYDSLEIE